MIYLVILLLLVVLIYRYDYQRATEGRLFWLFTVTAIFIIVGGLHYRLGLDSAAYERFYEKLRPLDEFRWDYIDRSRFAPGFILLASFTKVFSPDLILLNFIQSGFVCCVATWFFKNNTRNPFFALLIFFVFMFTLLIFEQIRESIAAAIFLLAWPAFRDRRWLIWYVWSLCALAFHTSASIMFVLPLIAVPGIKQIFIFGKRTWIICGLVFIFALFVRASFSRYIDYLAVTEATAELTSKYEGTDYVKGNLNIIGICTQLVKNVVYPVLAIYFIYKLRKNTPHIDDLDKKVAFTLLSVYVSIFAIEVPIVSRFNNYFFFFPIVLMSDWLFEYFESRGRYFRVKFVYWIIFFLPMFSVQFYTSYYANINKSGTYKTYMAYYPYTSYLDKEKIQTRERIFRYVRRNR